MAGDEHTQGYEKPAVRDYGDLTELTEGLVSAAVCIGAGGTVTGSDCVGSTLGAKVTIDL